MAPRPSWKGSMGFGMVSVPVKLYSATEEKAVRFHSIHKKCNTRIQMPKWCPTCNGKVEAGVLVAQRWILAVLRQRTLHSLADLNTATRECLERLNQRTMRRMGKSRRELFESLDRQRDTKEPPRQVPLPMHGNIRPACTKRFGEGRGREYYTTFNQEENYA
ncbi:MAG: hypothetical protein HYX90_12290 [Chloroflexi bacterium]|nr:hypothetical protein [Chloroflexota bacterium]